MICLGGLRSQLGFPDCPCDGYPPHARLDGLALGGVVAQLRGLETTLDHEALAKAMATNPAGPAPESLVAPNV